MSVLTKAAWKVLEVLCPDRPYLSLLFKTRLGYAMDWKNPRSFNQKLQWMKLYDRNPLYSKYADKVEVRDFVAQTLGERYLIPSLGVFDRAGDIDWEKLPDRFVLKCNHGAKYNVICRDKSALDIPAVSAELDRWLKTPFWRARREYHYRAIRPRILCEQYMEDEETGGLNDYKVFMIGGEPRMIQVDLDRFGEHRRNLYDRDWNLLDAEISFPKGDDVPRPAVLDEMLSCAKKLAEGFREVRVDFYVINGRLYFGEMTFFSGAGFSRYKPRSFEFELGEKLELTGAGKK